MRPGRITRTCPLVLSLVLAPAGAGSATADTLYGIIDEGDHAGYLITIDVSTGKAEFVGDAGIASACVLAFDSSKDMLLISNCFGYPGQAYEVDRQTGASLGVVIDDFSPNDALAYHAASDGLYAVDSGYNDSILVRLDPDSGAWTDDTDVIQKGPVTALAADPVSHNLYGIGLKNGQPWLFRITVTQGDAALPETDIAQVDRVLDGLAFDRYGKLYATDGDRLCRVDLANGAV